MRNEMNTNPNPNDTMRSVSKAGSSIVPSATYNQCTGRRRTSCELSRDISIIN
jgi:hypothetical protein